MSKPHGWGKLKIDGKVRDSLLDANGYPRPSLSHRAEQAPEPYVYRAELVRVIDGDTIVVDLDLGLNDWRKDLHVRLLGINCPETRGSEKKAGEAAKQFAYELLATELDRDRAALRFHDLIIDSRALESDDDSFGRLIAIVWIPDQSRSLNQLLLDHGHAKPYNP